MIHLALPSFHSKLVQETFSWKGRDIVGERWTWERIWMDISLGIWPVDKVPSLGCKAFFLARSKNSYDWMTMIDGFLIPALVWFRPGTSMMSAFQRHGQYQINSARQLTFQEFLIILIVHGKYITWKYRKGHFSRWVRFYLIWPCASCQWKYILHNGSGFLVSRLSSAAACRSTNV